MMFGILATDPAWKEKGAQRVGASEAEQHSAFEKIGSGDLTGKIYAKCETGESV